MKKIYILLYSIFVLNTSLNASSTCTNILETSTNTYKMFLVSDSLYTSFNTIAPVGIYSSDSIPGTSGYASYRPSSSSNNTYIYSFNGSCSCAVGEVLDSKGQCSVPPPPTCTATQFLSDDNTTCIENTVQSQETQGDLTNYNYLNGDVQTCTTSLGICLTYDKNGLQIPNIPINGTTYNNATDNLVVKALKVGGVVIGAVAGAVVIYGSGALLAPAVALGVHGLLGLTGAGVTFFV